jgi:hypothetical protein
MTSQICVACNLLLFGKICVATHDCFATQIRPICVAVANVNQRKSEICYSVFYFSANILTAPKPLLGRVPVFVRFAGEAAFSLGRTRRPTEGRRRAPCLNAHDGGGFAVNFCCPWSGGGETVDLPAQVRGPLPLLNQHGSALSRLDSTLTDLNPPTGYV